MKQLKQITRYFTVIIFSLTITSCGDLARMQAISIGATSAEADAAQSQYNKRRSQGYSHMDAMQLNNREIMKKTWGIGNLP